MLRTSLPRYRYANFLQSYYRRKPALALRSFDQQLAARAEPAAGAARCPNEPTYERRMTQLADILERHFT